MTEKPQAERSLNLMMADMCYQPNANASHFNRKIKKPCKRRTGLFSQIRHTHQQSWRSLHLVNVKTVFNAMKIELGIVILIGIIVNEIKPVIQACFYQQ